MHLAALVFAVHFKKLFKEQVYNSVRKMFGAPFHNLIAHLPEQLRRFDNVSSGRSSRQDVSYVREFIFLLLLLILSTSSYDGFLPIQTISGHLNK